MKKTVFIKNAFIMTVTALILRSIGIFFRIYLSNKIGAEGIGLYQLIFSIYVLASTFASSGICTAVTRLITDELACGTKKSVLNILRKSILLSAGIGLLSAALVFFTADFIGLYWLKDARAIPALKVLCPSLPFMGISSCLRGYFIARRKASSPSRAQIFEQLVRISVIMFLINQFADKGITFACVAVIIGDALAETASCIYLGCGYLLDKRKIPNNNINKKPAYRVLSKMLSIAVPITAGRYLNSILRTIENILVPDCLTKYTQSKETSLSQFGMLKGMAMPLLFFPSSFLSALSTLLIPEISEANALKQKQKVERTINRTLHITLTASILISGIFTMFAKDIGMIIYDSAEVGFLLQVLAPLMPVMYLESVVDGILKGLNQQTSSLLYSVADSVVRIILIFVMVPIRGMEGFLFVMIVSNLLTSFLNIHRLLSVTGLKIKWGQWIIKPILAMATSSMFSLLLLRVPAIASLPQLAYVVILGVLAAGLYCLILPLIGCVTKEDLQLIRTRKIG